jgi:hypothetical protein
MQRLDKHDEIERATGPLVFSVVRNEINRLPFFLQYYRGLGVQKFYFIDNASSDGSLELLLAQNDCFVFWTDDSFANAECGQSWIKELLDLYGTGRWCLVADADELLVYPACEEKNLPELCRHLDAEGAEALYTLLLDMYPEGSLANAVPGPDRSFFDIAPCFDKDYRFVDRIHLKKSAPFPRQEVLGGPRSRCLYNEDHDVSFARRLLVHILCALQQRLSKYVHFPVLSLKPPALFKVPLIKWQRGYQYLASTHVLTPVRLSTMRGALAHFKFFADFHDRVADAIATGQHTDGSAEYKQYWRIIQKRGDIPFAYEGTLRYTSSQDLLAAGLILTDNKFMAYYPAREGSAAEEESLFPLEMPPEASLV